MQFLGEELGGVFVIPSEGTFNTYMRMLEDLPPDLVMKLDMVKLGPGLTVPCIPNGNGGEIGSW